MKLNRQFLLFIIGGSVSAIVDIGIMQLMISRGVGHVSSATGGFFFGLLVNYAFHARLTFRAVTTFPTFFRFLSVVGINYFITIAFVSLSFSMIGNALIGKIASLPVIAINGFLLSKHWVFK